MTNHEKPADNSDPEIFVIDSLPKLAQYLGAVALNIPDALVKILQHR